MAKDPNERKPLIEITPRPRQVRCNFGLPEDLATAINDYADFLSERTGMPVTPSDVVAKAMASVGLEKDRLFVDWKAERAQSGIKRVPRPPKGKRKVDSSVALAAGTAAN